MSVSFITRHVNLLPPELAWGYRSGFLNDHDVVKLAESMVSDGYSGSAALDELSLLLGDEVNRVPDLIDQLAKDASAPGLDPSRVWLFLVLSLFWEQREHSTDPLARVEEIYADFDYPQEIEGFVPFLPAPAGSEIGPSALETRWSAYLTDRGHEFAHRPRPSEE